MIVIEVNAIRRSGHHAFINWLISNIHGVRYEENLCKWKYNIVLGNKKILWVNEGEHDTAKIIQNITDEEIKPDILIISYEAPTNDTLANPNMSLLTDELRKKWGITEHIHIPFVRDFYNGFASLANLYYMKEHFTIPNSKDTNSLVDRYLTLYREQLKRALNTFRGVVYDKWVSDEGYANEVCIKLIGKPNQFHPLEIGGTKSSYDEDKLKITSLVNRYKNYEWPKWVLDRVSDDKQLSELIEQAGFNKRDLKIKL